MKLNLVVDMRGCPNRCRHCRFGRPAWGNMRKETTFFSWFFPKFFEEIVYYSWLRELDYGVDNPERWRRDW